jgi:hypothetical protein
MTGAFVAIGVVVLQQATDLLILKELMNQAIRIDQRDGLC